MKKPIRKNTLHKLWAWLSLCINIMVSSTVQAIYSDEIQMFFEGILIAILCFAFGLFKIYRDVKVVNDFSSTSVYITYICMSLLSLIVVSDLCLKVSFLSVVYIIPAVFLECIISYVISKKRY